MLVKRISQPDGNGPNWDTGCTWTWRFEPGPMVLIYCWRRGSTQVVVLVLWSTKYGRPSGVVLISQPGGSGPDPAVVMLCCNAKTLGFLLDCCCCCPWPGEAAARWGSWISMLFRLLSELSGNARAWCCWRSLSVKFCCSWALVVLQEHYY